MIIHFYRFNRGTAPERTYIRQHTYNRAVCYVNYYDQISWLQSLNRRNPLKELPSECIQAFLAPALLILFKTALDIDFTEM